MGGRRLSIAVFVTAAVLFSVSSPLNPAGWCLAYGAPGGAGMTGRTTPVEEQNVDEEGNIRVHEQGVVRVRPMQGTPVNFCSDFVRLGESRSVFSVPENYLLVIEYGSFRASIRDREEPERHLYALVSTIAGGTSGSFHVGSARNPLPDIPDGRAMKLFADPGTEVSISVLGTASLADDSGRACFAGRLLPLETAL